MEQKIEVPTNEDTEYIAKQLIWSNSIVEELTTFKTTGTISDLELIQRVLDSNCIEPESINQLYALGLALGYIFIKENAGYDWWMVEDEYGRDVAIRYKETSILSFPQTMISNRIEDDEKVDVKELYYRLVELLNDIREKHSENT